MTKMTYVQALENAINNTITDETIERLTALKESLVKRAAKAKTAERKPSKEVVANAEVKAQIVSWMKANAVEPMTSAEIAEGMGLDVRKVRALIGRCNEIKQVKVNSKLNKWEVGAQA